MEHLSEDKRDALQTAASRDRDPFYSGICAIPEYQRLLYYTHKDLRRIDFSNAGVDDLEALYRACKPAEFGRNDENVLDESYLKAGDMDPISFATLFDLRSLGIHEKVSKALLTQSPETVNVELSKLNVYGKGDFSKAHKDTPRGQDLLGTLVVVLPTSHEGGQLVLRQRKKEWTLDFTDKFATATEPSACFVAFFGNIEHEVLPVTSGYRVTLTYNLYRKPMDSSMSLIPTPFHLKLKQALVDLVNDKSKLPNGGYLGFGLTHEYVHTGHNVLDLLLPQLKGSDRALADVCDELGLRYSLKLLYREITEEEVNLITDYELDVGNWAAVYDSPGTEYLRQAIEGSAIENVECVSLRGGRDFDPKLLRHGHASWLESFFKDPITEVLEITPMESSVDTTTSFATYGNEAVLDYFYGTACMLIAVGPAKSRDFVGL